MSLLELNLPWWLSGQAMRDLKKIAQACWDFSISQVNKIFDLCHVGTCPEAAIDIYWSELPIQPDIDGGDRRNFIKYYKDYLDYLGTRNAIELTQGVFNLDNFILYALRDTANADLHPWFAGRVYMSWDGEKTERIVSFIRTVAPARCKYHMHLVPYMPPGRFGYNRFGKRFG